MKSKSNKVSLGKTEPGKIILGDCVQALASQAFPMVDLVHTSPPYNIDKPYQDYTDKLQLKEYLHFISKVAGLLSRRMRLGASLFWQTGYTQASANSDEVNPIDMLTFPLFREHGFYLKDRVIWRYYGGMSFKSKFKNQHETLLWFVRGDPENSDHQPYFDVDAVREKSREHDPRNNLLGRNPGNVWEVDRVAYGSIEQTSHIAVFPEEVTERIVRACSKPGDVVLDPFLGSGTVAKVARSLGRQYVGIELSRAYHAESIKRVGFQQFGEVDTVLSELLKSFLAGGSSRASIEDCRFYCRHLAATRPTEIEARISKWCRDFTSVDDVVKKDKPGLWVMGESFIDALPSSPTAEVGLLSNIATAYLSSYKLARHFNGLKLALLAHTLRTEIEPVLRGDAKLEEMVKRILSSEPSSFETMRGGEAVVLKRADRRVKESLPRQNRKQKVEDTEPVLL
jgi:adenine-specific DNA-methyltransferase